MPWTALPYADRERVRVLYSSYEVREVPSLLIFDVKTGDLLESQVPAHLSLS